MSIAIGNLLLFLLSAYMWVIIISVIVSWLIAFEVLNVRNAQAANLVRLLERVTEPVYRPIRKYIPSIGGIDLSPIVVIFGIYLLQSLVGYVFMARF